MPGNGFHGVYLSVKDAPAASNVSRSTIAAGTLTTFDQPYSECTMACSQHTDHVALVALTHPPDANFPVVMVVVDSQGLTSGELATLVDHMTVVTADTASPSAAAPWADGKYTGTGGGSLDIAFTASPSGISSLTGDALLACTQTNGNGLQYSVNSTIPLTADGSFSSNTTQQLTPTETAGLAISGTLDRSGHASGTWDYKIANGCDAGPIKWTASIMGSPSVAS